MRVIACLLLALFVSSAFFGICNGEVWFEGYDPNEPQEIQLNMQHKQPIVSPYTALPKCGLILSEAEPQIVNLTIIVSTAALLYQDGNFETWLSIDDQEPEKLVGILDSRGSAAGQLYKCQYTVNLSGLRDGAHFIKIRVSGDYYGPEDGNYDCEGNVSVIIDTTPPKVSILFLEDKTYSAASIPLNFITNERISHSSYSLDGQENVTINANTTLTGLSEGDHNVTVYATDEAGNIGASETIYFRIESFPTTLVIASVVTVAVIGIVLLVYFKKRKH
jgi:hypothetical protein